MKSMKFTAVKGTYPVQCYGIHAVESNFVFFCLIEKRRLAIRWFLVVSSHFIKVNGFE